MKTAFITGGARGIGLETAKLYLSKGWQVTIMDVDQAAVDAALKSISHSALIGVVGSVLSQEDVSSALEKATSISEGKLDLLINNVGIVEVGEFDQQSLEDHLNIVDVNLKGYLIPTYLSLDFLKRNKHSKIVNMSSASAIYGNPEITTYAATKSAIMSLTEAWNIAFRKYGISVSDVLPIYVRTRMVDDYHQKYRNLKLKDVKLTAEDVARVIHKASVSRRIHHYVGFETKVYARLVHFLPDTWLPGILRMVLGYKD
jgi:short-subunit dehydrogenase